MAFLPIVLVLVVVVVLVLDSSGFSELGLEGTYNRRQ